MTILRHYLMTAIENHGDDLHTALAALAAKVSPLPGSEGVELLRDMKDTDTFVFIERWVSVEAHKAAGNALGKDAFAPVMALLVRPPEGRYLDV